MFFFRNSPENMAGRLVWELFLFFEKGLNEVNASDPSTLHTIKTNYIKF